MIFHVRVTQNGYQRGTSFVSSYLVSDQPDNFKDNVWSSKRWPVAAEFPVSDRYDQETQRRRAYEYCDYLNKGIVVQPPIGASNE